MKHLLVFIGVSLLATLHSQILQLRTDDLVFRNVGPANAGGRVVDIEAHPDDFTKVYIASASGGVWKSENAGTTWKPIFDDYETASIGDIAIDPSNTNIIWVGTGEANNRNSVSWGNGIYKSIDGGNKFENMGLQSTHQISRVLVNPKKSDEVCVCALGHLWGYSGDRGLFKTSDGGKSWQKKIKGLPNDGKTGCIDLVRDSKNPKILYTAFYHRLRQPWHFHSGGDEGGIYKSTDGGESWVKLTNGLPSGPTGRIGLAIYDKNPNILMAIVEAKKSDTLSVAGSGIYRSEDGGKNWKYVNTYNNRPFYYSQIRINPHNDQKIYVLTTRFMVSSDGGKTFVNGSEDEEVHGDFHALWSDPKNENRYYLGADKGFSLTHDHGKHFQLIDNLPIAQFYRINYDMTEPYNILGGLQDNGSYGLSSFGRDARGILNDHNWKMHWGDGQYSAINPSDPNDAYTGMENGHYFRYNPASRELKNISPKLDNVLNYPSYVSSEYKTIEEGLRFNWSAPFIMSSLHPSTIYLGGNHIFKSVDKGISWEIISPDLSTNDAIKKKKGISGGLTPDNSGAETHCTVYSISVSSINENILWAGTDDGLVHMTRNGGMMWTNVRPNISEVPENIWVSRVIASRFDEATAYVSFDGHQSDYFDTWIFKTTDFGKTWKKIVNGFSLGEVVRVIYEDHVNPNLLFAGTETGLWISLSGGQTWEKMKGLPTVSVYDIKIHPREHDLIVGTHGRGVWIMDDISPLQQCNEDILKKKMHVFHPKVTTDWNNVSRGGQRGHFWWAGDNPKNISNNGSLPRAAFNTSVPISFYIGNEDIDSIGILVSNQDASFRSAKKIKVNKGINRFYWDREFDVNLLSTAEFTFIDNLFKEYLKFENSTSIQTIYQRFLKAKSPIVQRKAVESFERAALSYSLPEKYTMPKANEGSYNITLVYKDMAEKSTFTIKKDK